ncbi:serine hydrolase domain-containing protein [Streptomyces sp. NPDC007083]|uniref:serine hydrolase domain-containing protein n=1 Tax=Streptomyces sp. NPDC007083 TaxID=3156913 RepID=UPI0033D5C01F
MRAAAYAVLPASVLVVLAGLLGAVPPSAASDGREVGPPPGVSRGFDRPTRGFAPAGTVLSRAAPARVGLGPGPVEEFLRRLPDWTDPASGAEYLFPGATALLAHDGAVVARRASGDAVRYTGQRELPPRRRVPARTGTVYDIASLTKLFTSIVALQQVDAGRLRLDAPVDRYLPAFAARGKGGITLRQLLTHTSGLPAEPRPPLWTVDGGPRARRHPILRTRPFARPGASYQYSDINMISLQLVLERVTGRGLEALVRRGITEPLRMHDTAYRPPAAWRPRIAATSFKTRPARGLLRGAVHDDNAWALGGVAGHAGRRWQRVHARLPAGPYPAGLRLRWRYTTTGVSGGRGVNLAGVRVTDATRVLFDGDCPATRPAAHGWRPLPPPRPPAYASGLVPGGTALGCPREALPGTTHRPRHGPASSRL